MDRFPGELAGTGPVHAELVRDLVARMGASQWRFALTDATGRLLHTGLITARPSGDARRASARGIVEIQIRDHELQTLMMSGEGVRWAPVVGDVARAHRLWLTGPRSSDDDPRRRTPGAALRRLLETRDGHCFFLGCRAPAARGQIDHTIRWTDQGPTLEPNLGAGCTHDHRLKDEGGWTVSQPEPGRFHWISRLGHHYHRSRALIIEPMPTPHDRDLDDEHPSAHDPVQVPRPPPGHQDPPF